MAMMSIFSRKIHFDFSVFRIYRAAKEGEGRAKKTTGPAACCFWFSHGECHMQTLVILMREANLAAPHTVLAHLACSGSSLSFGSLQMQQATDQCQWIQRSEGRVANNRIKLDI